MKLYYTRGACSLSAHIALNESGLPFERAAVDLAAGTADGLPYKEINPKGYVPALIMNDGSMLTECVAILQWVADKAPEKNLLPAWGEAARYKAIEDLNFLATEVHKGFGPLWNPSIPKDVKDLAIGRLQKRFAYLDQKLSEKPYMLGDNFSVVDGYLFTLINWSHFHKIDMSPYPSVLAHHERVRMRPAVQKSLEAEGMAK